MKANETNAQTKSEAWEAFKKSGKVSDYLIYNGKSEAEIYGNDKNKGNSDFADSLWRE